MCVLSLLCGNEHDMHEAWCSVFSAFATQSNTGHAHNTRQSHSRNSNKISSPFRLLFGYLSSEHRSV